MSETPVVESKAAELHHAFDQSFAMPPPQVLEEVEDLLTIRVAGLPYAIRLLDIAGMVAGPRVVPVPTVTPGLLGLAGIRGGVVPVFGLASILGYEEAPGPSRWMVLCGADEPIALAFSDFEGYLRLPKSSLQIASTEAGNRVIIDIPLVVETIRNRIGHQRMAKEH
jgi:purine-binding chemotaxis protein CheW